MFEKNIADLLAKMYNKKQNRCSMYTISKDGCSGGTDVGTTETPLH